MTEKTIEGLFKEAFDHLDKAHDKMLEGDDESAKSWIERTQNDLTAITENLGKCQK